LALGHVHKQYDFGGWAYNPGSLETVSAEEVEWDRGFYEVVADTESRQLLDVRLHHVPRRPFLRYSVPVEACRCPQELEALVLQETERRMRGVESPKPVLHVSLRGTLQFADDALKLDALENLVRDRFEPLVVRLKNNTVPTGYDGRVAMTEDGQIDRRALELQVLTDRIGLDSRYAARAPELAGLFQRIKDLALEEAPAGEIVELLDRGLDGAKAPLFSEGPR
ncbi:MAG: hypothetical protein M3281_08315, partial [Chloroflexota bacterium]|nr:hypothetical protein [Chloroflexota bacterium]